MVFTTVDRTTGSFARLTTRYKMVCGLRRISFIYFRNSWATVNGVERLWMEASWRLTEPSTTWLASPARSVRSIWKMAQSCGMNRERSTASHVMISKLSLLSKFPHSLTARLFALKCAKCQLPIVPDQNETSVPRLRALNKDFHPDCFCCDVSFKFYSLKNIPNF